MFRVVNENFMARAFISRNKVGQAVTGNVRETTGHPQMTMGTIIGGEKSGSYFELVPRKDADGR